MIVKINFKKVVLYVCIFLAVTSCGRNENKHLNTLKENVSKYNDLKAFIELRYDNILTDSISKRERIVFVDCVKEQRLSPDYICDDVEVLKRMKNLDLREIRFERKVCNKGQFFTEIYFQKEKFFHYPIVYFLYEYCGVTQELETQTIYYKPIDSNWSLYIDSNYP